MHTMHGQGLEEGVEVWRVERRQVEGLHSKPRKEESLMVVWFRLYGVIAPTLLVFPPHF